MGDDDLDDTRASRRVVLFDLDGCLIDSTEPILQCLNAALVEFELGPVPRYDLARHVGPPLQTSLTALLEEQGADPALVVPVIEAYRSRYKSASIELAVTYPGIPALIQALAETERLGVCTSKPIRWAEPILEHLGLSRYFEVIAGPGLTEVETKEETLARALGELDPLDRAASLMIGDRHHDIDAAQHHGLRGVGVTWGFGTRDELLGAGAEFVVDTAAELRTIVEPDHA